MRVVRKATPNRDAEKITTEDALDIARLASLRMWNSYNDLERMNRENEVQKHG